MVTRTLCYTLCLTILLILLSKRGEVSAQTSESVVLSRGDDLQLICSTSNDSDVLYIWFFNATNVACTTSNCSDGIPPLNDTVNEIVRRSVIAETHTLQLYNLSAPENGGDYVCVMVNNASVNLSRMNVHFKPTIVNETLDKDIEVDFLDNVTLTCQAEGFPFPSIQWQKLMNGSFEDLDGQNNIDLVLATASLSDSGTYRCAVSNIINNIPNSVEVQFNLSVNSIPPNVTIVSDQDQNLVEQGDQLNITCSARGGPNNVFQWMLNGQEVTTGEGITIMTTTVDTFGTSTLSISSVDAGEHKGSYICQVTNNGGQGSATVVVTVSPAGITSTSPEFVLATPGSNVTIRCETDAGPNTQYIWFFKASELLCVESPDCIPKPLNLTEAAAIVLADDPDINIRNISIEEAGEYTCITINEAGIEMTTVDAYLLPRITKEPQSVETSVQQSVNLSCQAEGFPTPTLQWQKHDGRVFEDLDGENGTFIIIQSVQYNNAGVYRCVAAITINGTVYQTESTNASLTISVEGTVTIIDESDGFKAVKQLDEFNLTCQAQGGPNNVFTWKLNGKVIEESGVVSISPAVSGTFSKSTLSISSINATEHKGNYTCLVSNMVGQDMTSVIVVVSPVGIATVTPDNDLIASPGDNITFIAQTEAGPGTEYIWFLDSSSKLCVDDESQCDGFNVTIENPIAFGYSLALENVNSTHHGGIYYVVILNDAGMEVISRTVFFLPRFIEQPQDIETDVNQRVALSTAVDGFPLPDIQWQRLINGEFMDLAGENETTLEFTSIDYSDAGVYRCVISSTVNSTEQKVISREATVSVSLKGTAEIKGSDDGRVEQEDVLIISCTAKGGPNNTYRWTLNGEDVEETSVLTITTVVTDVFSNSTLSISSVDAAKHKGNYTCLVSNRAGQDMTSLIVVVSPFGIVTVTPGDVIAIQGDNFYFKAETDAGPDNKYSWQFSCLDGSSNCNRSRTANIMASGDILSNGPSLNLSDVSVSENGGRYTCTVSNTAGMETVTRTVYFLPRFIEEPQDVITVANERVVLSASADGFPFPTFQWQKLINGEFVNLSGENETTLEFTSIDNTDAGVYRCAISSTVNETRREVISREASISISLKDTAEIKGSDGLVEQRDVLVISCTAEGGPNNTQRWTFNGEDIEESSILTITTVITDTFINSTLRISSINATEHKGNYTCLVSNMVGKDMTSLVVVVSPAGIVTVTPGDDLIAIPGDNLTFIAQTEAGPGTEYLWFLDSSSKLCVDDESQCDGFNITIENPIASGYSLALETINSTHHGGIYYAVIVNDAGMEVISRTVFFLPRFIKQPQDIETDVNQRIALSTTVDGFPLPDIQWQRRINGEFMDLAGENETTLEFTSIDYSDAGVYRCVISSTVNSTEQKVISREATVSVSLKDTEIKGSDGLVDQEDVLVISCTAEGGPNNTQRWTLNGEDIEETSVLNITTIITDTFINSTLRINSVDAAKHKGNYTCLVSNRAGQDITSLVVVVSPVGIVTVTPDNDLIATPEDNITFIVQTEAGPGTEYIWFLDSSSKLCVDDESQCDGFNITIENPIAFGYSLALENVNSTHHGGIYYVVILNDAGIEVISRTVFFLPRFIQQPKDIETDVNQRVALSTAVDGFPLPDIQWQRRINGEFMDLVGENETTLEFTSIDYSDAGVYRCVISSTVNNTEHKVISREATVSVSLSGTVMIDTGNPQIPVKQGDDVNITCSAQGGPGNSYTWKLNGKNVEETGSVSITAVIMDTFSRSTLRIRSVDAQEHQGTYLCAISNMAGSDDASVEVVVSPQDILSTMPTNVTVSRGDDVEFTCQTDAGPNTKIIWLYNSSDVFCNASNCRDGFTNEDILKSFISNETVITVNDTKAPLNGGVYTCIAFNDAGVEQTDSVLNVEPEFVEHPQSLNTTRGRIFNLTCSAEAFPFPAIQWQKKDNTSGIFVDIDGQNGTDLEIDTDNPETAGIYRCRARTVINGEEKAVHSTPAFIIISLMETVSLIPQDVQVDYNDNLTLHCSCLGGPDNVFKWYLDGTLIESGERMINIQNDDFSSTLTIYSLNVTLHGGTFMCEASNAISKDVNGTTIFINPRFLTEPSSIFAEFNTTQQLNCEAESFPYPVYQWSKRNSLMNFTEASTLLFDPIQYEDEGFYTCHASSYGITINSTVATVYVSPLGSVVTNPVINAHIDDRVVLMCSAKGGPDNQFSWTYITSDQVLTTEQNFMIRNVTVLDGGDYKCNVSNQAGFEVSMSTINVEPEFTEQPEAMNVSIMVEDIELQSSAIGYPIPTITWRYNNTVVYETERVNITTFIDDNRRSVTSILIIYETVLADSGFYHAVVTNLDAYEPINSDRVLVLVQDIPDAPFNVSSENVTSRLLTLKWSEPDDKNSPIQGYLVFYTNPSFLGGKGIIIPTKGPQEELEIAGLHPGTLYQFSVIAFNGEGNSTNRSVAHTVTTLEEVPNGPPVDLDGLAITATDICITWKPPLEIDRNGVILSYDILYEGMDMNGTIVDEEDTVNIENTKFVLKDLEEYTVYEISVRARTAIGSGPYSQPIAVLTNESMPGPVQPPSVSIINETAAFINWEAPDDPNGVITTYLIEYSAQDFVEKPFLSKKRQIDEELLVCFEHLGRNDTLILFMSNAMSALISNLLPFTLYKVRIAAVTIAGPGNFSQPSPINTLPADPGEIINLHGTTRNSTTIVLAWNSPPCPFGLITGYRIYFMPSHTTQSGPNVRSLNYSVEEMHSRQKSLMYDINELIPKERYAIHVRAFYDDGEGVMRLGIAILEINITLNGQLPTIPSSVLAPPTIGSNTISFHLPSITLIGADDLVAMIYYGVVVVAEDPDNPFDPETDVFESTYPNIKPYQEDEENEYYIAAAWNDMDDVPDELLLGDKSTTNAVRHGVMEEYINAELKSKTQYCLYILSHHISTVANETVIRYTEVSCQATKEREKEVVALWIIILVILLLLLLCCCCLFWICCFFCIYCRKEKETDDGREKMLIPLSEVPPESDKGPISIIDFPLYVKRMHQNQDYPFSREFEHIEPKHHPTYEASRMHRAENRFTSLPAYDHSRVVLEKNPTGSDYINANYIQGYEDLGDFIATQGPLSNTTGDFWWMVWEKQIPIIVMLTNLEEKGRVKCHQYWPEEEGYQVEIGPMMLTMVSEAVQTHQTIRTFDLTYENSSEVKRVIQYHLTSWPDHGVPKSTKSLLEMIEYIRTMYKPNAGPILVHCGTGVGRSGAFIALYVMLARLTRVTTVDIYNYVQYMRKQRISMVSNETEYIFVHDALVDALRLNMIKGVILGLNDDVPQLESGKNKQ